MGHCVRNAECMLSVGSGSPTEAAGSQIITGMVFHAKDREGCQGNMEPLKGYKTRI